MYDLEKDVENVARAIQIANKDSISMDYSWRYFIPDARAALNASDAVKQIESLTAQLDEAKKALSYLWEAKQEKDAVGKTGKYLSLKAMGWDLTKVYLNKEDI